MALKTLLQLVSRLRSIVRLVAIDQQGWAIERSRETSCNSVFNAIPGNSKSTRTLWQTTTRASVILWALIPEAMHSPMMMLRLTIIDQQGWAIERSRETSCNSVFNAIPGNSKRPSAVAEVDQWQPAERGDSFQLLQEPCDKPLLAHLSFCEHW
jgi:hypothetical protein